MDPMRAQTPAEIRKIKDPAKRFHATRAAEPLMKAELAAISRDAVNEMYDKGAHAAHIAAELGISRQRVSQLIDPVRLERARSGALDARVEMLRSATRKAEIALERTKRANERRSEAARKSAPGHLADEDVRAILAEPDASDEELALRFDTSPGAIHYVRSERAS